VKKRSLEERTFTEHPPQGKTGAAANMASDQFYPDVPDRFWAAPDINRLTCQDVLVGYPDGLFKPNRDISRAEMATMAVKGYEKGNIPLSSDGNFSDVPRYHWAYENINRAATSDLLEGLSCNIFKPEGKMTRVEALNVIGKGQNCPTMDCDRANQILSKFTDGDRVPSDMRQNVAKAIDAGALKHQNQKTIGVSREATRAEVSTMLQNMRLAMGLDNMTIACEPCHVQPKITQALVEVERCMHIPTLELTMKDMINSKNSNVGDQFAASTVNPITIAGVTYPAGSRVNGKIMEVIRPSKGCPGAIRLSFNNIVDTCGKKVDLPKQVLTARVDDAKNVNGFARTIQMPFTWVGSLVGTAGRTVGGVIAGAANAVEDVFDNFGTGSSEVLTGQFRAGGRSYQDSLKSAVILPVDITRTAISGATGLLQTTGDEATYLVNPAGFNVSQVNPKQKVTIAFGSLDANDTMKDGDCGCD
jgi:hypothetical protein